jgi:hypothetical protein
MKFFHLLLFLTLGIPSFAQDETDKPSAKSTNRLYIGANVSPIFVAMFNRQNYQAELKLAYKRRLASKNHDIRLSYSCLDTEMARYNPNIFCFKYFEGRKIFALNDSMAGTTGVYKNINNFQTLKLSYEYQLPANKNNGYVLTRNLNYRPEVMLNYCFEESASRNSSRQKRFIR